MLMLGLKFMMNIWAGYQFETTPTSSENPNTPTDTITPAPNQGDKNTTASGAKKNRIFNKFLKMIVFKFLFIFII